MDSNGRLLLSANRNLSDAADLADLLCKFDVCVVVHFCERHRIRGRREDHNRAVGRIDLAIDRRRRKVGRKLPPSGIDCRLNIVGSAVDIAVEIELHDDGCNAEAAGRRGLCDARNLRELAFERLGNVRSHRFRTSAWKICRDLDRRKVDLRQRSDGQVEERYDTDEKNSDHDQ